MNGNNNTTRYNVNRAELGNVGSVKDKTWEASRTCANDRCTTDSFLHPYIPRWMHTERKLLATPVHYTHYSFTRIAHSMPPSDGLHLCTQDVRAYATESEAR